MKFITAVTIGTAIAGASASSVVDNKISEFKHNIIAKRPNTRFGKLNGGYVAEESAVRTLKGKGKGMKKSKPKVKKYTKGFGVFTRLQDEQFVRVIRPINSCYQRETLDGQVTSEKITEYIINDDSYQGTVRSYASGDCKGSYTEAEYVDGFGKFTAEYEKKLSDAVKVPEEFSGARVVSSYLTSSGCVGNPEMYYVQAFSQCFPIGFDYSASVFCDDSLEYGLFNNTDPSCERAPFETGLLISSGCVDLTGDSDDSYSASYGGDDDDFGFDDVVRDPTYFFESSACLAGSVPKSAPKGKEDKGKKSASFLDQVAGFASSFLGGSKNLRN